VLAIAPAVFTAALIARYAVDVPYYDDWDNNVPIHIEYLNGSLSPGIFFNQSNDSRPALPRFIWLISDIATHSSRPAEMWISFAAVCVTSLNLFQLARRTVPLYALPLIAIANWFLFSTVQYENWLWANQLMLFLPVTLFTSALAVTYCGWRIEWKIGCSIVLWICSTICFVSGFFFWPLLLAVQLHVASTRTMRINVAGAWIIALALTAGFYYANLNPVAAPARPELLIQYPKDAFAFVSCYFASPFRVSGMTWYQLWALGAAVVALVVVPLVRLLRDRKMRREMLPWAAILGFTLISGAAATSSRLTMGLPQSQASRYTTTTVLLPIAGIFLWTITRPLWSRQARRAVIAIGGVLLVLHLAASFQRVHDLQLVSAARREAKDALLRINVNDHDPRLLQLYPDVARLKQLANEYSALGQLPPLETQPPAR
jgi:hypothetical protein